MVYADQNPDFNLLNASLSTGALTPLLDTSRLDCTRNLLGVVRSIAAQTLDEASPYFGASARFRPLNAFALGLLVLALAWRTHTNIFLAAFAAGVSVPRMSPEVRDAFSRFGDLVAELLKLAAILIFGLQMAPTLFQALDWQQIVIILAGLFGARMVAIELALLNSTLLGLERAAMGWFGPKGFGSVVYGLMVLDLGTAEARGLAHLVGVAIMISIVLYSSTDILVARWFQHHAPAGGGARGV